MRYDTIDDPGDDPGDTAPEDRRPGVGSNPATDPSVAEQEVEDAFLRVVDEGRRRLSRRWTSLLATGLIPVSTVIARQARTRMLVRLWVGTLATNLLAGWIFTWLIMRGFPELSAAAINAGYHYVQLGTGLRAFCLAVLGGAVITLMTWMQHTTPAPVAGVVAAIAAGFLLAGGSLDHAIVSSLLMFAALHTGHAPFGYGQWAVTAGFAALGNMVGGIALVTVLRLLQVPHRVKRERENPAPGVPIGDHRRAEPSATEAA